MNQILPLTLSVLLASCTSVRSSDGPQLLRVSDRVDSKESVSLITEGQFAGANKRSPFIFGDKVAFVTDAHGNDNLDIWSTGLGGQGSAEELVTTGQNEKAPVIGRMRGKDYCVFITDASSKQEIKAVPYPNGYGHQLVVAPTTDANWPALAPDGSAMLYSQVGGDGAYDIHHYDLNAGVRTTVTDGQRAQFNPADSGAFVFTKEDNREVWNLFTSRVDEQPVQITFGEQDTFDPSYSPDGRWIAYVSNATESSDIWVMDAMNPRRTSILVSHGAADCEPAWTEDGLSIVFASDRNEGVFEIYRVRFDPAELGLLPGDQQNSSADRGKP